MSKSFTLGGSPLGLVGVRSRPTRDGMSSFNGGESRNINVNSYNTGEKQKSNNTYNGESIESRVSLFTGGTIPNFWGNLSTSGSDKDKTGLNREYDGINRQELHNNDIYDTSILNIIEKLSFSPKASLRPQDFAYLKKVGVYPNNRLMIARRFTEPQNDNIMDKNGIRPMSVLISWKPQEEDFIEFSFNEKWENAEADFGDIFNKIGKDFMMKSELGSYMEQGAGALPLPGFTEDLQRKFLAKLGVLDNEEDILPSGNPNLIKQAKRRKLIGYGDEGSGLECDIKIKMEVEYEQKFISGIDPTIAWMDIMANALSFGTSPSSFYGLNGSFAKKINEWTGPGGTTRLVKDTIKFLKESINELQEKLKESIDRFLNGSDKNDKNDADITSLADNVLNTAIDIIDKTVGKYKIQIMGITHALSGLPSTPWHITIGNPLRPIFSSGDMYTNNVNLKLGNELAFNDLPSNIKIDFTLMNARPLGLQEILAKFNTGYLRTVNIRKDFTDTNETPGDELNYYYDVKGTEESGEGNNNINGGISDNENILFVDVSDTETDEVFGPPTTKENDI